MQFSKKIFFIFVFCFNLLQVQSQENATLLAFPSPGNSMHYEDLWNLTMLITPPNVSAYYFLEIEVEEEPGSSLWKAKTYTFKIETSPFTVSPTNISSFEPININFIEDGWQEKMTRGGGLFPPGNYKITYRLIQTTAGCTIAGKLLATVSIFKTSTSLFPPSLLFPFNNDSLENETPVFAWSPVMPVQKKGINYSVRIAEISGSQTAEQSITNNRPYLYHDAGESLTITYPAGNMPLQKGGNYAWQVIAKTSQGILSYSEVWRFVIKENENPDTISTDFKVFLSVKKNLTGPVYLVKGNFLFVKYDETYTDSDGGLTYVLSSSDTHENILTGKVFPLAEQKGFNNYALDITSLRPGNYVFLITDEKGNKGYVSFKREE